MTNRMLSFLIFGLFWSLSVHSAGYRGGTERTGSYDVSGLKSPPAIGWTASLGDSVRAGMVEQDGTLYVAALDGEVTALSIEDGQIQWRYRTGYPILAALTLKDDLLMVADSSGRLHRLNRLNGKVVWDQSVGAEVSSAPIIHGDLVWVGDLSGTLTALRIDDGKAVFTMELGGAIGADLALFNNTLLLAAEKQLVALNMISKKERWRINLDKPVAGGVTASNQRVFVATLEGMLFAFDIAKGRPLWLRPLSSTVDVPVTVVGEQVFAAGNGGELQGFDVANGKPVWVGVSGGAFTTATASQDAIYVSSEDGMVYAFASDSGEPLWEADLNTPLLAPPLPYEKGLLVANEVGEVIQLIPGGDDNGLGYRSPFVEARGEK